MSATVVKRVWKCKACGARSTWRDGWNWRLDGAVETLDSFTAFCSIACLEERARQAA